MRGDDSADVDDQVSCSLELKRGGAGVFQEGGVVMVVDGRIDSDPLSSRDALRQILGDEVIVAKLEMGTVFFSRCTQRDNNNRGVAKKFTRIHPGLMAEEDGGVAEGLGGGAEG